MAKRDSFLLRTDPAILAAIRRWADDELRSMNGQIEFLLRRSLKESGRLAKDDSSPDSSNQSDKPGGNDNPTDSD